MSIQPSPKLVRILLALTLPGGVLLLLFPKQADMLVNDLKSRIRPNRNARKRLTSQSGG
ncbi:hypothetical protein VSS37_15800 [Candidatus Thiothrix sp. Deng01]|uniref:Uncharacterized protein n=1 Tax=Candidatus Thiothrix phosphatis TaxID=3112415 RepID=A0ABU6D035_9GAMM|nr:hypothetical protein [Candidatus Thiothrix sp. Deng01]MEB4592449.1 hypothetical protein [Candidatus Thiothrix sp. Deng01]